MSVDFGYHAWHMKLRQIKGAPDECISCGDAASDWALKSEHHKLGESVYVEDPDAYEALCRSCHVKRDRTGWTIPDEGREKIARSKRGKSRDEATKSKISQSLKGRSRNREAVEAGAAKLRGKTRDPSIASKGWEVRRARYGATGRKLDD